MLTYLPSGWLADRIPVRVLLSFSLAATGLLGLWFSTMPSFDALQVIFACWGIATGLTFWSAHIKAVALLAKPDEQGRFFGILDGGRGLFEALLATIAVAWFAYAMDSQGDSTRQALLEVIYIYVFVLLVLAPLAFFTVDDHRAQPTSTSDASRKGNLLEDLKRVLSRVEIWLCAGIILCGYQLFWATYSFSGYLQNHFGMTAVTVGSITVAKLWMRPIGAATAGFAGDFLGRESVLTVLLILASLALAAMAFLTRWRGDGSVAGCGFAGWHSNLCRARCLLVNAGQLWGARSHQGAGHRRDFAGRLLSGYLPANAEYRTAGSVSGA